MVFCRFVIIIVSLWCIFYAVMSLLSSIFVKYFHHLCHYDKVLLSSRHSFRVISSKVTRGRFFCHIFLFPTKTIMIFLLFLSEVPIGEDLLTGRLDIDYSPER